MLTFKGEPSVSCNSLLITYVSIKIRDLSCKLKVEWGMHCVKSVQIRNFSGPYFPVFSPNTRKYRPDKASVKENRDERKKWIVKDAVISHLQLLQTGFIRDQHCVKCVRIRSYSDPYSVRKRESSTKHTINIYLFNSNTRKMCEICSKLTIKTLKQRQWFWAYFTLFLVFLLLILNK